jgi:hypothetical protein
MKKPVLIFVGYFLFCSVAIAQLGVGTLTPNPSAQLEIVSADQGVLIPRVPLESLEDDTTITSGNVNSLLIYNTTNNQTLSPGYYYWLENGWQRIMVKNDIVQTETSTELLQTPATGIISYTNEDGTVMTANVVSTDAGNIVTVGDDGGVMLSPASLTSSETTTSLSQAIATGVVSYTDEDGGVTTANVISTDAGNIVTVGSDGGVMLSPASLTSSETTTTLLQALPTGVVSYIDEDGGVHTANVISVEAGNIITVGIDGGAMLSPSALASAETTSTLTQDPATLVYTYTDEDATATLINNDMGSFTGDLLTDNVSLKTILQELESKIEKITTDRIGEFVFAETGKSASDGYLAISPGNTVLNANTLYPIWWAKAPGDWKTGNNITIPSEVGGAFLRNLGGSDAAAFGVFQDDATAVNGLSIDNNGAHNHSVGWNFSGGGNSNINGSNDSSPEGSKNTSTNGEHSHDISSTDNETRPKNFALQLYVIVDSYK